MNRPTLECEAKFIVKDEPSLRALVGRLEQWGIQLMSPRRMAMREVYLDTEDFWLWRAGIGLRARFVGTRATLTLKTLRAETRRLIRRVEWEEDHPAHAIRIPGPLPRGNIARWMRRAYGTATVRPLVELDHEREEFDAIADHKATFKLCLDRVRVTNAPSNDVFHEIELELANGSPQRLEKLVRRIQRETGWELSHISKYERALEALGFHPPASPPVKWELPHPSETMLAAAWRILGTCFARFEQQEPGARAGLNPECLHDLRVTTRRLRAALRVFRKALPPDFVHQTRARLRLLFRRMGLVRDLDIGAALLRQWANDHPDSSFSAWANRLDARRERAWILLLRCLKDPALRQWIEETRQQFFGPPPDVDLPEARIAVREVAPRIIRRRFKRTRNAARDLSPRSSETAFHELRILVKKLRYTIEFFAGVHPEMARHLCKGLCKLQDELGALQDAVTLRTLLAEVVSCDGRTEDCAEVERKVETEIRSRRRAVLRQCRWLTGEESRLLVRRFRYKD